jgi:hypothetical protein
MHFFFTSIFLKRMIFAVVVVLATGVAWARNCAELFAATGSVVNQQCIWVPGGYIDIPMYVVPHASNLMYVETWDNANSLIAPYPVGVQRGDVVLLTKTYNSSTNCGIALKNNVIATPVARNWTSAGPDSLAYGSRDSQGNTVFMGPSSVQSVACTVVRLWGSVCEAMLERLQSRLAIGLPSFKVPINAATVCY